MIFNTKHFTLPLAGGLAVMTMPALSLAQNAAPGTTDQAAPAPSAPVDKQKKTTATEEKKKTSTLEEITVTGSRIPRAQIEGPAPVIVIKAADIDTGGFRSVFDVLSSLTQNTGLVQGEDYGSTFTSSANFISLRGLGPNHTLVLVNGRRIADYPVAYNGSVNAVDLTNIPSVMIDHIDVLSGSASAIYGSDAIAGVVNVVLKTKHDGIDVSEKIGGDQRGGGENQRLQLIGGIDDGKLQGVYGVELSNRDPVHYGDRALSDSYSRYAQPGDVPPALFAMRDPVSGNYYDLPGSGCAGLSYLQHGSVESVPAPNKHTGTYCSSDHYYSDRTIQTKQKTATGYLTLHYALNDTTELFGDFMYGFSDIRNNVRGLSWSLPGGAFWNNATDRLENWTRVLTPEEIGGRDASNSTFLQDSGSAVFGVKGSFGDSSWHYEASANLAGETSHQGRVRLRTGIEPFFLGPQLGTHTDDDGTFPAYNADPNRLITPLTPAQFQQLSSREIDKDKAWTTDLQFTVNGELFDLPAGPVGVAGVLEAGRQGYANAPDARDNQGYFYNYGPVSTDSGERNRYAAGVELSVPIFSRLTASGAGRYDRYTYGGQTIGKSTYNFGLEFRPIDTLLLRGTYATSFRAPDMNYLFAKGTQGYEPGDTDYYQCRLDNQPYSSCSDQYNMNFSSSGNIHLKPETAKSFTYGLVWSPSSHIDFSADYYHIRISNELTNLDSDTLLRTDADCLVGKDVNGNPVDPNSSICRDAESRIVRNSPNASVNPNMVTNLLLNPVNAASEFTRGYDLTGNVRWSTANLGNYQFHAGLTHVLHHSYQQFPGDPERDYLNNLVYQTDWRLKSDASLSWNLGSWDAEIDGTRYGNVPNNAQTAERSPYMQFNGSIGYRINKQADVQFIVNNLRNSLPIDTSAGWPNYTSAWYNIYGRQFWLQFNFHFGAGKLGN